MGFAVRTLRRSSICLNIHSDVCKAASTIAPKRSALPHDAAMCSNYEAASRANRLLSFLATVMTRLQPYSLPISI